MSYTPLLLDELRGALSRPPVILLESARPERGPAYSYLFIRPVEVIEAERLDQVGPALARLSARARTHWVAGYVTYEAGYAFEPRLERVAPRPRPGPLLWFGVYRRPKVFDHARGRWRAGPARSPDAPFPGAPARPALRPALREHDYRRAIARIKRLIAAGQTYQVNFTFDTFLRTPEPPLALFRRLRAGQPVPYGAFIDTGRTRILSFSPELFFARQAGRIVARPMKGTAARGPTPGLDDAARAGLAADPKNRAENVMIVDLLRNDLGRICRPGGVSAGPLFDVETHPTLHQMTSTVTGRLRPGTTLAGIFRAIFPCGSVTGAPKIRTMQIIRALERGARGAYCGAIGYAAPGNRAMFSVAIRTLEQEVPGRLWRYRVGSGIVWDSRPHDEWEECRLKAAFLLRRPPSYRLLETVLWKGRRPVYIRDHLARLRRSAASLGFPCDSRKLERLVRAITGHLAGRGPQRVRILLGPDGAFEWESRALEPATALGAPVVHLWPEPVDPSQTLLYHKTTERPWYAAASDACRTAGCIDVIFVNHRGEVTEGTRTNVFARIGGRLYTPPVACGLLPGVLRARLIASGRCSERILRPVDLSRADALYCGNSVRGLVRVRLAPGLPRRAPGHAGHTAQCPRVRRQART